MPEPVWVALVAMLTVLATGIGALPVMAAGERAVRMRPALDGLVIGVMGVAAVGGLLIPAARTGSPPSVVLGAAAGAGGLWWARAHLRREAAGAVTAAASARLTFGVLLAHSLPEGLALGSALAASGGLAAFVVLAVAIQNVPEGTATAAAMLRAGASPRRQLGAAVGTSLPQLPGALIAWAAVDLVAGVLPASLAAAGAAMLLLVLVDLVPEARLSVPRGQVAGGALIGALTMVLLAVLVASPV